MESWKKEGSDREEDKDRIKEGERRHSMEEGMERGEMTMIEGLKAA